MGKYTQRPKGMFSLKRQVLRFLMALVILLSLLMVTVLTLLIHSYAEGVDDAHRENVAAYAENMENSIAQLRDTVGVIYSNNSIFQGLYLYQKPVPRVNSEGNMLNLLKLQVGANKKLGGLFIYYDSDRKSLYYVNEDMSFWDKEILKNAGRNIVENGNTFFDYVVKARDDTYYNIYIPKNSTAISGNISLSRDIPELNDATEVYGIV